MIGREMARKIIAVHGLNDPFEIARDLGIVIETVDNWVLKACDAFRYPKIALPSSASVEEHRESIAHCIGHYHLHTANQVWLRGHDTIWSWKQERQAEEFAAWLLIPEFAGDVAEFDASSIAQQYGVTQTMVLGRVISAKERPQEQVEPMRGARRRSLRPDPNAVYEGPW